MVEFTTIVDYLHLLRATTRILDSHGSSAVLYLAAAVSDFYIPRDKMVSSFITFKILLKELLISFFFNFQIPLILQ